MTSATLQAFSAPAVNSDTIIVPLRIDGEMVHLQGTTRLMRELASALITASQTTRRKAPKQDPGAPIPKPSGQIL